MKTKKLLFLLTLILTGLTFSSCSDDDDDNNNDKGGSTNFGPKHVFTGDLPKTIIGATIKYNSNGLCEEISNSHVKYTFEYPSQTKSISSFKTVIMKYNDFDDPEDSYTVEFTIGSNGFASSALQTNADKSTETWEFKYNSDGQLNYLKSVDGNNINVTTITYANGNITNVKIESVKKNYTTNQSIEYTSETHPNGIENKGCIMLFDLTFGTDTDTKDIVYYAGLLGRGTKKIPLKKVESESNSDDISITLFNWTLNAEGYPTKLICKGGKYDESINFGW